MESFYDGMVNLISVVGNPLLVQMHVFRVTAIINLMHTSKIKSLEIAFFQ